MPKCESRLDFQAETARMITGIAANGTQHEAFPMSAPSDEITAPEGVVAAVCDLLAGLPEKDGLAACIDEGRAIAEIVAPLGLKPEIVAAVRAYPAFREGFIDTKSFETNDLSDIPRFILGLQQLDQFSLWK